MTGWRDPILQNFTPEIASVARLTVVSDPDDLLGEPGVVEGILAQGFEIIAFDDHVRFRYAYEQRFRRFWDSGEVTTLVVVLRAGQRDIRALPYDLLEEAKRQSRLLSFSLAELFPNLQPQVLAELDRTDLDAVHAAQERHAPGQLGTNATREFVLRHVFHVAPELIVSPADLLRMLLHRHYSSRIVPASIDDHLIRLLRASDRWVEWPLEEIVPRRASFLHFLHERWPLFLKRKIAEEGRTIADASPTAHFKLVGPAALPFDHDDVRVYVDNLFIEGLLEPTGAVSKGDVVGTWMAVGVRGDETQDRIERLRQLLRLIEEEFPTPDADYRQWTQLAQRWGESVAVRWAQPESLIGPDLAQFEELHQRIEREFDAWLQRHYASLSTITPWPRPVMVHHIPRFLAHAMSPSGKQALIVVDGLSLDQWSVIRQESLIRSFSMNEESAFAWVPTLTSVSRQAIFAGEPPFFFSPSIGSTYKEPAHWNRFWEEQGVKRVAVAYVCQKDREDDDSMIRRVREHTEDRRIRALAVVVGTIDQMLHGTVTGTDGLHASVRNWAQRRVLANLIQMLLDAGFQVALTADHGNVEGRGFGKPDVGVTAEQRGERVHLFRDQLTRSNVAARFGGTLEWPQVGLPGDYFALLAPARKVFIGEGKRAVAHGGICIEEVIVPFIRFTAHA